MSQANRDVVIRYFQSLNQRDWEGLRSTLADEVIYEIPQTRERIRGLEPYVHFNATFPGDWTLEVERVVADQTGAAARAFFRLDGEEMTAVVFFELEGGKIHRILDYWPEPYQPPERKSPLIERY